MSLPAARSRSDSHRDTRWGEVDRFLVPLGNRKILSHFCGHLFVAHNFRERLARTLAMRLSPTAFAPLILRRLLERPHPPNGSESMQAGRWTPLLNRFSHVLEGPLLQATSFGSNDKTSRAESRNLRWIVLADYPESGREKHLAFLFREGESRPRAVLKLRTEAGKGSPLGREAEALRSLAGRLPASLRRTVPKPLAYYAEGLGEALLLSAVPGRSAYVEMQGSFTPGTRIRVHFTTAALWLARFHRATLQREPFSLPAYLEALPGEAGGGMSRGQASLEQRLASMPLRLASSHGDFWARNLMVLEAPPPAGLPAVVDWEHFREAAPPFEDLFQFPLTYGLNYPWSRYRRVPPEEAFRKTFLERNAISRHIRLYFDLYCTEMKWDIDILGPLFRLFLIRRAGSAEVPTSGSPPVILKDSALWLWFHQQLAKANRSVFSG